MAKTSSSSESINRVQEGLMQRAFFNSFSFCEKDFPIVSRIIPTLGIGDKYWKRSGGAEQEGITRFAKSLRERRS
jgi:hypothetical protein